MNDSQPPSSSPSPRARMQELLAIPDRNRTDAEWDELNELEIALASGNRPGAPDPQSRSIHQRQNSGGAGRMQQPGGGGNRPQGQNKGPGGGGGKKFHKRPGKRRGGGGGNPGNGGNGNGGGGAPPQAQ
ncbi:MAG: hypothetical protein K2X06_14890 [Burkholderiales bacterium]|nr:hypothetical protein [Burkholderiales bacterium]